MDATLNDLLELPAELSAKARAVPGLPERLLRFIRMEVAMNERRQQRYSPEALAVVQRARALVEKRKAEGTDRAEAMRAFEQNFNETHRSPVSSAHASRRSGYQCGARSQTDGASAESECRDHRALDGWRVYLAGER